MEKQFIKLHQWNRTVDKYATEFLRLSQFAPYIVTLEKKQASRFEVRPEDGHSNSSYTTSTKGMLLGPHHSPWSGTWTGEEEQEPDLKQAGEEALFIGK